MSRWDQLVRVGEWAVLLPVWRRFIKSQGWRIAAASGTGLVWLIIIVAIASGGGGDNSKDKAASASPTSAAAGSPTATASPATTTKSTATAQATLVTLAPTAAPTAMPIAVLTPAPTAPPTEPPAPEPTQPPTAPPDNRACHTDAPANPWGYDFCSPGNVISSPPSGFCSYFDCIASFSNGTGYVVQCADGTFSKSGGKSGACSQHGGVSRSLYSH